MIPKICLENYCYEFDYQFDTQQLNRLIKCNKDADEERESRNGVVERSKRTIGCGGQQHTAHFHYNCYWQSFNKFVSLFYFDLH